MGILNHSYYSSSNVPLNKHQQLNVAPGQNNSRLLRPLGLCRPGHPLRHGRRRSPPPSHGLAFLPTSALTKWLSSLSVENHHVVFYEYFCKPNWLECLTTLYCSDTLQN